MRGDGLSYMALRSPSVLRSQTHENTEQTGLASSGQRCNVQPQCWGRGAQLISPNGRYGVQDVFCSVLSVLFITSTRYYYSLPPSLHHGTIPDRVRYAAALRRANAFLAGMCPVASIGGAAAEQETAHRSTLQPL